MKVNITYVKPETERAEELAALYVKEMQLHGSVIMTRSEDGKPFNHIYINDGRKQKQRPKRNIKKNKSTNNKHKNT